VLSGARDSRALRCTRKGASVIWRAKGPTGAVPGDRRSLPGPTLRAASSAAPGSATRVTTLSHGAVGILPAVRPFLRRLMVHARAGSPRHQESTATVAGFRDRTGSGAAAAAVPDAAAAAVAVPEAAAAAAAGVRRQRIFSPRPRSFSRASSASSVPGCSYTTYCRWTTPCPWSSALR
jgi:hypothetical protein